MVNYSNGKVYKIINETEDIYIGSCCCELSKRFWEHKHKNNKCRSKLMFNEDRDNCRIILIENYSCENREQLRMREQYWIDYYKNNTDYNVINKNCSYLTEEQKKEKCREYDRNRYNENRQEYHKQYQKIYNEKNKDKIKEDKKKYREKNRKKLNDYNKQYNIDNIEKLKDYRKQYREQNKERLMREKRDRDYFNGKKLTNRMSVFLDMLNQY